MTGPAFTSTFDEIAQVIGKAATRALCQHLGGTTLYVPAQMGLHHPVTVAIGPDAARQLAAHFRGSHLQLPKGGLRRERVHKLKAETQMTIKEIALATDYSERWVYKLLADGDDSDDQLDLFK